MNTEEYAKKKLELLELAEQLFEQKTYEKCTINDILKEAKIAKGTFYYYFKSKEEVLNAIIESKTKEIMIRMEEVVTSSQSPEEKLVQAFLKMQIKKPNQDTVLEELHKEENAMMHIKSLRGLVQKVSPYLEVIVKEGIQQGIWTCDYPKEYMELFLTTAINITDVGIVQEQKEQNKTIVVLVSLLEKMLQVEPNHFINLLITVRTKNGG